jgi:hypothetical protein
MAPAPPLVPSTLPANALSIENGVAALIIEPFTRELTEAERAAILEAKRVRIFIDHRADANLSRPVGASIKIEDYPADTLRFCIQHATRICMAAVDPRKKSTADEIEALLSKFDGKDLEDERVVIRIVTDSPFEVADYMGMHRPYVPFQLASSRSARTEQASEKEAAQ